ncbi:MAG: putative methyltransferase [Chloroflexi bacterium]|nr:MAG: putative methyltransferase [Chloroflexota bacterium]MBA4374888.1 arsenite S-adenosylmethyltransferase [Anaerolinea sp.]
MANQTIKKEDLKIRKAVREHYAEAAVKIGGCCGDESSKNSVKSSGCGCGTSANKSDASSRVFYNTEDLSSLPEDVTGLSLGCGDPVTLASLKEGQTVLDLGSGGGIDCFLAGKKVGTTGRVIGVDMTPEMLDQARANRSKIGAENVEFRLGEIEHLPVADDSVDVVISNCVINLSTDKPQVLREILRVLKPGGRMAVSDIVTSGELPEVIKQSLSAWAGCIAGAMDEKDFIQAIQQAGFKDTKLTPVYFDEELISDFSRQIDGFETLDVDKKSLRKTIFSAKITAEKP